MKRKIGTKIEDIRFQATAIKFFKRKREYVHVEGPVSQVSKQLYRGIEKKNELHLDRNLSLQMAKVLAVYEE